MSARVVLVTVFVWAVSSFAAGARAQDEVPTSEEGAPSADEAPEGALPESAPPPVLPPPPPGYAEDVGVWQPPLAPPPPPPAPPTSWPATVERPPPSAPPTDHGEDDGDDLASVGIFVGVGMALGVLGGIAIGAGVEDGGFAGPPSPLILSMVGGLFGLYGGLTVASIYYAANATAFPIGWAVLELIAGGLVIVSLVGVLADTGDPDVAAALPFLVIGGWLAGHGMWSLAAQPEPDAPVAIGVAPVPGGAAGAVVGRF